MKEGIRELRTLNSLLPRNYVIWWQSDRVSKMSKRCARIEDAVAPTHNQASRIKRRVRKADARREVVWIVACDNPLTDIRHLRQIVLLYHIACLHKSADGWTAWNTANDKQAWLIERRVEGRDAPARIIGGQGEVRPPSAT